MTPGRSQNLMSTYSTFSSEMYLSTSSELLNTLTGLLRLGCWFERHAMGGGVARPSLVSFLRLTGITPQSRRCHPGLSHGPLDRVVDARDARTRTGDRQRLPGRAVRRCRRRAGSVAGFGRRLAALTVDWLLGYLIAGLFAGPDPRSARWILVAGARASGSCSRPCRSRRSASRRAWRCSGMRVASLTVGALVGVPRAVLRTALLALVLPALVRDVDGRGWHDRAAPRSSCAPAAERDDAGVSAGGPCAGRCASSRPAGSGPLGSAAAREPSAASRVSSVVHLAGRDVARAAS